MPACLTASVEDCTFPELFEFTTRQLKITRVYAPRLWAFVLVSNLLFVAVFFGGLALAGVRAAGGASVRVAARRSSRSSSCSASGKPSSACAPWRSRSKSTTGACAEGFGRT